MTPIELARHLLRGWKEQCGLDRRTVFTHQSTKTKLYSAVIIEPEATLEQVRLDCAEALEMDRTGVEKNEARRGS